MTADAAAALFDDEVRLLLQAALLPVERALPAFRQWRARCDLDAIRAGPQRLLPLVHANIELTTADDAVIGRINGIRKYCWVRNQMLVRAAAAGVRALAAEQIPTILLKGAAMVAEWYRDLTLRPMSDVDLLVPADQAMLAIRCLGASGWEPQGSTIQALCEVHVHRLNAWNFRTPSGSLDLHWHALHQAQQDGADRALWNHARPSEIAGSRTAVLAPEEQLFHILGHGLQAIADDAYLWPVDAAWILRRDGAALDWGRVVALAEHARITLQIGAGLRFLRQTLEVSVPDAALAGLARTRATWSERREFALRRVALPRRGRIATAFLEFQNFRRRSGDLIVRAMREAAIPFLQDRWRIDRPGATLAYAAACALDRPSALARFWLLRPRRHLLSALRPLAFEPGVVLSFAQSLGDTLVYGWSEPEQDGRWSEGAEAVIALDLPEPPAGDLRIEADANPLLAIGHPSIAIDVWVNERFAARWRAQLKKGWLEEPRCTIPARWLAGARQLIITFVIRRPRRPADISGSPDRRKLGLYVRSLRFTVDVAT